MQHQSTDRDFAAYNAAQQGRPVRPLARRAVRAAQTLSTPVPVAVELGCGVGIEAAHLAAAGFRVWTYDADPSAETPMQALAENYPIHHRTVRLEELTALPDADLILSCATLSFVPRAAFENLWHLMRASLRPGGVLAIDLFGERDDWAGTDGYHPSRHEVEALLANLEVIELGEREFDGRSFAGPKHWHTLQIIARHPETTEEHHES